LFFDVECNGSEEGVEVLRLSFWLCVAFLQAAPGETSHWSKQGVKILRLSVTFLEATSS
jgi:hypothetical protein